MTNEQDWLDAVYGRPRPFIKATSVGDDEMGCLVSMEWSGDDIAEHLVVDVQRQVPKKRQLVHFLVAAAMQYALERASREAHEA